jgi:hypothetical protein
VNNVRVVISTMCSKTPMFNDCRDSVIDGLPDGVSVEVVVDRNSRGKVGILNEIMRVQQGDFIYLHDDMQFYYPGWYEQFVNFAEAHPDAGILTAQQKYTPEYNLSGAEPEINLGGCYFRKAAINKAGVLLPDLKEWALEYFGRIVDEGYRPMFVPILIAHKQPRLNRGNGK